VLGQQQSEGEESVKTFFFQNPKFYSSKNSFLQPIFPHISKTKFKLETKKVILFSIAWKSDCKPLFH